jgi:hypothetical protein
MAVARMDGCTNNEQDLRPVAQRWDDGVVATTLHGMDDSSSSSQGDRVAATRQSSIGDGSHSTSNDITRPSNATTGRSWRDSTIPETDDKSACNGVQKGSKGSIRERARSRTLQQAKEPWKSQSMNQYAGHSSSPTKGPSLSRSITK